MLSYRWSVKATVVVMALLPVLLWGVSQTQITPVEVTSWLPQRDVTQQQYRRFLQRFAVDQSLLISWPGCTIDSPQLGSLARRLREVSRLRPELGIAAVENPVDRLRELEAAFPRASRQAILDRMDGQGVGRDGAVGLVLRISPSATAHRAALLGTVRQSARGVLGEVLAQRLVLAGEPVQANVIDEASRHALESYVVTSALLATAIAYACLRDVAMTAIVLALAGIGQAVGLALTNFWVGSINALLIVVPTLVFMLALSAGIHLAKYFRDAGGWEQPLAGLGAVASGGWPCLLAALTTMLGFASLAVSRLAPVRHFGVLAAVGLGVSIGILLAVFPAVTGEIGRMRRRLVLRRDRGSESLRRTSSAALPSSGDCAAGPSPQSFYAAYAHLLRRWAWPTVLCGVALGIWGVAGIWRLQSTTSFESMFAADHPTRMDLDWVRTHLGPTKTLEVILEFALPDGEQPDRQWLQRLRTVQTVAAAIGRLPEAETTMSCMSWVPSIPTGAGVGATLRRAAMKKSLESSWGVWRDYGLVHRAGANESYRITVGYIEEDARVEERVRRAASEALQDSPVASQPQHEGPARVQFHITGLQTVLHRANGMLIRDLVSSFSLAFLLVTPAMIFAVRRVAGGLWLMLPNVLPVLLALGAMGWAGVRLDVACILTASVALGIAVDDTVHYVCNYMRSLDGGDPPTVAVTRALQRCLPPMCQTTCICIASLSPFLWSDFLPTRRFAVVMMLILTGAIVGDLVLLPAMLLSPLGRRIGHAARPVSR